MIAIVVIVIVMAGINDLASGALYWWLLRVVTDYTSDNTPTIQDTKC
jgi:hypothetical protein